MAKYGTDCVLFDMVFGDSLLKKIFWQEFFDKVFWQGVFWKSLLTQVFWQLLLTESADNFFFFFIRVFCQGFVFIEFWYIFAFEKEKGPESRDQEISRETRPWSLTYLIYSRAVLRLVLCDTVLQQQVHSNFYVEHTDVQKLCLFRVQYWYIMGPLYAKL